MLVRLGTLCAVLMAAPAVFAETHYVSTTGSDGNSCAQSTSTATPKRTFGSSMACLESGDILEARGGTYAESFSLANAANGTAGAYTTIQNFDGETVIIKPTGAGVLNRVIYIQNKTFFKIRGQSAFRLVIDATTMSGSSSSPIGMTDVTTDIILENVEFIGSDYTCVDASLGGSSGGGYATRRITVRNNYIHDCGVDALDHGVYLRGSDHVIEGNHIHDVSGSGVHSYGISSSVNNHIVRYNISHDAGSHGILVGSGSGHQVYGNVSYNNGAKGFSFGQGVSTSNLTAYNNTSYGNATNCIHVRSNATGTILRNNICRNNGTDAILNDGSGTVSSNTFTTDPSFVNAAGANFTLATGSAAIDACSTATGLPYNGSAPDCGAYETTTFSSAVANQLFLDVTLVENVAVNFPWAPTTAGWSAACTGTNCAALTVSNIAVLTGSSGILRLTATGWGGSGVCEAGQTITVSYSATTGNTLNARGQELRTFTTQAVTNACGTPPPNPPTGVTIRIAFDENSGTTAADAEAGDGEQNVTLTNGASWLAPGLRGTSALTFLDQGNQYGAVAYGSGVNPTTTSFTDCLTVRPHDPANQRIIFGTDNGTSQRYYAGIVGGTLSLGIGASPFAPNIDFPVSHVKFRVCLVLNHTTDTATLYKDGVKGTSAQSVKGYSFTALASNLRVGLHDTAGGANAGGVDIDDFHHYPSALSDAEVLQDFQNTEPPSPPAAGTLAQVSHQWNRLRKTAGGTVETYGAVSATMPVMVGGAVSLVIQTDCTVANCSAFAARLRFNVAGGAFVPVPDTMGAPQVEFFTNPDVDVFQSEATCCLSGALTANHGSTNTSSASVPVNTLTQNSSVTQRYVIRTGATTAGQTICFKLYDQNGNALSAYTPSAGACMTVVGVAGAMGF